MKSYLMNVIFAVMISVFADMIVPTNWKKYLKTITGLIILCSVLSPIKSDWRLERMKYEYEQEEYTDMARSYTSKMVINEVKNRIEDDVKKRLKEEFNVETEVMAEIEVNCENEITSIKKIILFNKNIPEKVSNRINEIYEPKEVVIGGY